MRMRVIIALMSCASVFMTGCVGKYINTEDVVVPGAAAAAGVTAYYVADKSGSSSGEAAAWGGGTALATYIVGKIIAGKADAEKIQAFQDGFSSGRAYGARRQYEIIQDMQKSNSGSRPIKTYTIPATGQKPGVNQVPYNVYLEVVE